MNTDLPWVIIGYGRVGKMMGLIAAASGQSLESTWNRTPPDPRYHFASTEHMSGDLVSCLPMIFPAATGPRLVFLTVIDQEIEPVFSTLAPHLPKGSFVVHTSGSLSSKILRWGSHLNVGSLHPLQAITDPHRAFRHITQFTWSIEGDPNVVAHLHRLLAPLKIHPIPIETEAKILYHASAVTTANLMVSLFDTALAIAEAAGIPHHEAREMLIPLARSSVENLASTFPAQALSGPVARGDNQTIEAHKAALANLPDKELLEIYSLLTRRAKRLLHRGDESSE